MYSDALALELIDLIYGAAVDPAKWSEVLQRLALALNGDVGTMHHQDTSSQDSNFSSLWNLGPEAIVPYTAYYGVRNPLMTTRPALIKAGAVNTRQMLCPDENYLKSEYYQDFMRPLDLRDCIAATLRNEGANSSNISIFRSPRGESYDEEERKFLLVLIPHLQRAFQLHNRIQGLESKGDAAADALDQLQQGVVLLDAKGNVLLVNRAAKAILSQEKALQLTRRGLNAAMPSENRRLSTLIHGALETGNSQGLHSGGAMQIAREDFRQPLQVLVIPLRAKSVYLYKETPVAAIFITDPEHKPLCGPAVYAQLFGLTRAEARLAEILASGTTLKEASEQLGVAESTVKSQLKSIFAKTGTSRQSQLIRLILLSLPKFHQEANVVDSGRLRAKP